MQIDAEPGVRRLLDGLSVADQEHGLRVLGAFPTAEVDGAPGFATTFASAALLLVVDGFVVLRARLDDGHTVVTCEAGAGDLVFPPSAGGDLRGLGPARLCVIDMDGRRDLLQNPALAERLFDRLAHVVAKERQAIAQLGLTRHRERVRRKLLQLAHDYGHVISDGVRIDFPVSHALLAEMIGSSRETVTRAVDDLQRGGFVARSGSTYRLLAGEGEPCHSG